MSAMNIDLARDVVQELVACGVEEFVVCSGSRNSPLINVLLNEGKLKKWWGFEERSSAFFALGRIRQTGRPVAVVTTSGTAVGELLPATMESHYTGLPLVLVTADRPKRFRAVGAPQSCVQPGIYSCYTAHNYDVEGGENLDLTDWDARRAVHVNVCFEEPAKERAHSKAIRYPVFKERSWHLPAADCFEFLESAGKLLTIVSTVREAAREQVKAFLKAIGGDYYLEGVSGLREEFGSVDPEIGNYTHVLRIGGVPTHRIWRDIEEQKSVKILSLSEQPFAGLTEGELQVCNLEELPLYELNKPKIAETFSAPNGLYGELSALIPEGSLVYLGNSCPIRDWDKYAVRELKNFDMQASRGLNGIDGQMSTFLGLCKEGRQNWAILGDLTTLYDLSAPWFLPQMGELDITLVVMNNQGGRIFEKLYPIPEMVNAHHVSFEGLAKMWKINYEKWTSIPKEPAYKGMRLVEIVC